MRFLTLTIVLAIAISTTSEAKKVRLGQDTTLECHKVPKCEWYGPSNLVLDFGNDKNRTHNDFRYTIIKYLKFINFSLHLLYNYFATFLNNSIAFAVWRRFYVSNFLKNLLKIPWLKLKVIKSLETLNFVIKIRAFFLPPFKIHFYHSMSNRRSF